MERLHETPLVVDELGRILKEDYPYLEYCVNLNLCRSSSLYQRMSDALYVRVKSGMENTLRDRSVIEDICDKLSCAINVPLLSEVSAPVRFCKSGNESLGQDVDTGWLEFYLYRVMIYQDFYDFGGMPMFIGTRVPVKLLINSLKGGDTLDDFLERFPSVSPTQVIAFLEFAFRASVETLNEIKSEDKPSCVFYLTKTLTGD